MATGKKELQKLTRVQQLELQNIMLKLALEHERIENLSSQIGAARKSQMEQQIALESWKRRFNVKLQKIGTSIDKVDVDAETGAVEEAKVKELKTARK